MKSSQPGTNIGTPIKIEDPNQFVPLNTDPTEVLDKRNRVSRDKIPFINKKKILFLQGCPQVNIVFKYLRQPFWGRLKGHPRAQPDIWDASASPPCCQERDSGALQNDQLKIHVIQWLTQLMSAVLYIFLYSVFDIHILYHIVEIQ